MNDFSPLLSVETGLQAGASLQLPGGTCRIGTGLANDIVVADPTLAAMHLVIMRGPTLVLRAADGEIHIDGKRLRPGQSRRVNSPVRFRAGNTVFRLDIGTAPVLPARAAAIRAAPLGLIVLATAALLMVPSSQGEGSTARLIRVEPAKTAPVEAMRAGILPTLLGAIDAVRTRFDQSSLRTLRVDAGADGSVIVSGSLAPEQRAIFTDAKRWFDAQFNGRTVLVDHVTVAATAPPLTIAAVRAGGAEPFVVDRAGRKLQPGSSLSDGWVLDRIETDRVTVRRGDQTLAVRF